MASNSSSTVSKRFGSAPPDRVCVPGLRSCSSGESGPTHAHVTTSPECWKLFARSAPDLGYRLLSDTYMAQHPDGDDPRQLQSVAVHLITLDAVLARGKPSPPLHAAGGAVNPPTFAGHVLSAWHATEGARIEEWTTRTLEALFGPANQIPG